MLGDEAVELAVVFEHASGRLLEAARRFVLALPELAGPALIDCQLARRGDGPLLVALARFDAAGFTPAITRRLTFWAEQYGGASRVLRDLDLLERANFLAQFEAAENRSAVAPGGKGLAGFFPSALPPAPLELELDLSDPRQCRWDFETAGLFVVRDTAPPVGDAVALRVNAPGSIEPLMVTGTVALVRTSGPQVGFALSVAAPPTGLAVALAELKRIEAQLQEEGARAERRATVRHAIAVPVELSLGPDAALVGTTVNISIDGAFIKISGTVAMNTDVRLRFELPGNAELRAQAKVVNVTPAGIGVRFQMDAEARGTLARTIAALVTPPPPPPDDELPVVSLKYATPEALTPHLQTLMVGGASAAFDPGLELQQAVQVQLELPDGSAHVMTATVVLASEAGVGLELHPDPAGGLKLREALAQWATSPPPPPDEVSELSVMDLVEDAAEASVLSMVDLLASPAPPSKPSKPPPRLGDYELLSLLGRGGMAEVYYARAVEGERAGRFAAIKRLSPEMASNREALDLFTAEADILHLLRHPNIVETFEVGMFQSQPYLVMEAVDGRDLAQIIRRCRDRRIFLPTDFACFLIKSVLDALDCAHHAQGPSGVDLNLVHCDVSPHNVFISRVGEIKLGDFGLAQAATVPGRPSGKVRGKPSYLSPEALDGEISVLADLWAVNVTLYELLTLQTPFVGENPEDQLKAIRKQRMKPPEELRPDLPKPLLEIVKRGFEKKPKHRFASADALAKALTPHFDPNVGTPLAIAAVVRGLFTT